MRRSFSPVIVTLVVALLFTSSAALAQNAAEAGKSAIRALLAQQVDAWNRGDLEGFMAGYWKSPELSFISGTTETRGWQPTLERYRKKYQGEGKEMGKLDFFDLRVEMLAPDAAFVRGHWRLKMKNGEEPGGMFTLILRKFPGGWQIIHDHTS
ncbi:MAG: nuclear transport factor 2 family protein [Acidobacteriia bacterium]|nr:nuclear transport factor 2 family protein [Terriglobia bacterium]